jgi:hypothetical protein
MQLHRYFVTKLAIIFEKESQNVLCTVTWNISYLAHKRLYKVQNRIFIHYSNRLRLSSIEELTFKITKHVLHVMCFLLVLGK